MVTTLTPHEVRHHFRAAQRDGIPLIPQCDACDARGGALFAAAYRHWRIERGFPDPGNLCALCAARNERLRWVDLASLSSFFFSPLSILSVRIFDVPIQCIITEYV